MCDVCCSFAEFKVYIAFAIIHIHTDAAAAAADDNSDDDDDDAICLQKSTVDVSLKLIDGRLQLRLYVTSGNVTLTSDLLLTTSDLVNTDEDDARCSFYVDINLGRNHVQLSSNSHFITTCCCC